MAIPESVDVLVDGEIMIDKKNIMLRFRGSFKQRVKHPIPNKFIALTFEKWYSSNQQLIYNDSIRERRS